MYCREKEIHSISEIFVRKSELTKIYNSYLICAGDFKLILTSFFDVPITRIA